MRDRAQTSLPYVLLLATFALAISAFFYAIFDPVIGAIVDTPQWTDGSAETTAGRQRLLAMWDYALVLMVTAISFTVLWASRRGL